MSTIKKDLKTDIHLQKKRQEMIDEPRLNQYNNGITKNYKFTSFKKFATKLFRYSYK